MPWYPRRGTRKDLAELFHTLGFKTGVEIGTRTGTYSEILCKANPGLKLACVDPWCAYNGHSQESQDAKFAEAQRVLKPFDVRFVRQPSLFAVDGFVDASLDFVYVDGHHSFENAVQDIIRWAYKVKPGGIVAVHDYHPYVGCDVMEAVNAYTKCHHIDPWYVTREYEPTAFWVQR